MLSWVRSSALATVLVLLAAVAAAEDESAAGAAPADPSTVAAPAPEAARLTKRLKLTGRWAEGHLETRRV